MRLNNDTLPTTYALSANNCYKEWDMICGRTTHKRTLSTSNAKERKLNQNVVASKSHYYQGSKHVIGVTHNSM